MRSYLTFLYIKKNFYSHIDILVTTIVFFFVLVRPSVTVHSKSIVAKEGNHVLITCNATVQPEPGITWIKSEGSLPESRTVIYNAELTILNVTLNDSGSYICNATNVGGSNITVFELLVEPASEPVTTILSSLLDYVGQNITIPCPIPTDPYSVITWVYNGTLFLPEGVVTEDPNVLKITSAKMTHNGNYTCAVQNSSISNQMTATFTVHVRRPKTCSQVKTEVSGVSGWYVIDPDGFQGAAPFEVYCNMSDKGGVGVTVISHDTENRTHVNGYEAAGAYSRDVNYTGVRLTQLKGLTDVSTHCEQFIRYECKDSKLFKRETGWWVSRTGLRMDYWGGATGRKGLCSCAVTNTCDKSTKKCNCDINDKVWREDSGLLTDKLYLPVSQLRFGDTGGKSEEGYYTLGKLKCYGMA